jgi:hypothetical protein
MRLAPALAILSTLACASAAPRPAFGLTMYDLTRVVGAETRSVDELYEPISEEASDGVVSSEPGLFEESVAPTCSTLLCAPATASQTSQTTSRGFTGSGSAYGESYWNHEGLQFDETQAGSLASFRFTLTETTPYSLSIVQEADGSPDGFAFVEVRIERLTDGFYLVGVEGTTEETIHGVLEPGSYEFGAGGYVDSSTYSVPAAYDEITWAVTFEVPEPGSAFLFLLIALGWLGCARRAGR